MRQISSSTPFSRRLLSRRLHSSEDIEPSVPSDVDWREFRARLIQSELGQQNAKEEPPEKQRTGNEAASETSSSTQWAHPLFQPEKGALLLASPMMFLQSQKYFYLSVILLLDHDATGSYGIVLNKPSNFKIGDLNLTVSLDEFADCLLYVGGDVGDGALQVLHSQPGILGSVEVIKGLFAGGIEGARQLVKKGAAQPKDFNFYTRYAGWGPGQLESEVKAGVWYVAASSPSFILSTSGEGQSTEDQGLSVTGREAWNRVMSHMGGNYEEMSNKIKAAEEEKRRREKEGSASQGDSPQIIDDGSGI